MVASPSDNPTLQQLQPPGPALPQTIAPHFPQLEILDILGAGGMGVVYKARQKSLDRIVALKVLPASPDRHESFAERFTREAKALARLQHPNIVTVYDSGSIGEMFFFIMEYVDGSNLRQLLAAQSGRLQPHEALAIVPGVCDALEYAHAEGLAHRDIKPENILLDRKGRVKIADFGIAKLLQRPGTDYTLTHTQQIIGTMHYMAPEQIEKPSTVDHRADIYSLGVVLYEMMTGELPIGRFPLPSERSMVDPRLDIVVLRALEKEPSRRYQRASEIKTDIQRLTAHTPHAGGFAPSATPAHATPTPVLNHPAAGYGTPLRTMPTPAPASGGPAWRTPLNATPQGRAVIATPALIASPTPVAFAPNALAAPGSMPTPYYPTPVPGARNTSIAYVCWFLCFIGFFGIHRFYAGKWISGFIWLFTIGCLFIGQGIDLLLIPRMIRKANARMTPWVPGGNPVLPPQQQALQRFPAR